MKGSDKVDMTINIGGEILKIDVKFDDQNRVRDAEREVKNYIDKIKKDWPDSSDRTLIAMAAFQFANRYHQLLDIQENAIELANLLCNHIDEWENSDETSIETDTVL